MFSNTFLPFPVTHVKQPYFLCPLLVYSPAPSATDSVTDYFDEVIPAWKCLCIIVLPGFYNSDHLLSVAPFPVMWNIFEIQCRKAMAAEPPPARLHSFAGCFAQQPSFLQSDGKTSMPGGLTWLFFLIISN